jgi:hypothetical protein
VNISSPVVESIENKASSAPDTVQVTVSFAVNVWAEVTPELKLFEDVASPAYPDGPCISGAASSPLFTTILPPAVIVNVADCMSAVGDQSTDVG